MTIPAAKKRLIYTCPKVNFLKGDLSRCSSNSNFLINKYAKNANSFKGWLLMRPAGGWWGVRSAYFCVKVNG